jgi:hypothetical protein
VPPAEFGYAGPRVRLDKCSYFSEFFLAQHTLIPEIFEVCEPAAPILASRSAKSANSVTARSGRAAAASAEDLPPEGGQTHHPRSHEGHQQEQIDDHQTSSRHHFQSANNQFTTRSGEPIAGTLAGSPFLLLKRALWQGTATRVQ